MGCLAESVKATRGKATIDLAKLDKALGVCDIVVALRMLTDGPADMASVPLGSVSITSTSLLGTITATRPCTFEIRALSQFVVLLSKRNHAVPFSRPRAEPQYSVTPLRFVRALPPYHTTPTRMTYIACVWVRATGVRHAASSDLLLGAVLLIPPVISLDRLYVGTCVKNDLSCG